MHAQTREGAPPFPNYRVNFIVAPMPRIRFLVPGPGNDEVSLYLGLGIPGIAVFLPLADVTGEFRVAGTNGGATSVPIERESLLVYDREVRGTITGNYTTVEITIFPV